MLNETGYLEALAAERTIEAEGRAENLEALIVGAAEFDFEREREGESEVPPLEEYLQQISLYTEQDELQDEESLITLMTLHNAKGLEYDTVFIVGCEDGAFPAHAGAGRGRRRRGAAALLRRHHPRPPPPLHDLGARAQPLRPLRAQPALALHRRAPGRADRAALQCARLGRRDRLELRRGRDGDAGRARTRPWSCSTGDDVVHASFGDGVVTAVEPGGVVVVRFSGDGAERKLMADYAPIRRR